MTGREISWRLEYTHSMNVLSEPARWEAITRELGMLASGGQTWAAVEARPH
jgi:hypothetical protein